MTMEELALEPPCSLLYIGRCSAFVTRAALVLVSSIRRVRSSSFKTALGSTSAEIEAHDHQCKLYPRMLAGSMQPCEIMGQPKDPINLHPRALRIPDERAQPDRRWRRGQVSSLEQDTRRMVTPSSLVPGSRA